MPRFVKVSRAHKSCGPHAGPPRGAAPEPSPQPQGRLRHQRPRGLEDRRVECDALWTRVRRTLSRVQVWLGFTFPGRQRGQVSETLSCFLNFIFMMIFFFMIFKQTELIVTLQLFSLGSYKLFMKVNPLLIHDFYEERSIYSKLYSPSLLHVDLYSFSPVFTRKTLTFHFRCKRSIWNGSVTATHTGTVQPTLCCRRLGLGVSLQKPVTQRVSDLKHFCFMNFPWL